MNKSQSDNEDRVDDLFFLCMDAEFKEEYEEVIRLCDEIFELSPDNPRAIGFKSFAYIKLAEYEKASELIDYGCEIYPENYYLINNRAILHYDMGEYEKSLQCCEEGLKIKECDGLCESKLKALIKLDRISEAIEFYRSTYCVHLEDLLIEEGKYKEALEFCVDEDMKNCGEIIDWIKREVNEDGLNMSDYLGDYYVNWIYKIKHAYDVRVCPDCGGELMPIIWGYPSPELMNKAAEGKVFLGGCVVGLNPNNYHCSQCGHEFILGYNGLEIEKSELGDYARYKIDELLSHLKTPSCIVLISLDDLKLELSGFDDAEFNAFISHLKDIGFIHEPEKGYVKLSGFEDMECRRSELGVLECYQKETCTNWEHDEISEINRDEKIMQDLCNLLAEIGSRPQTTITQVGDLEFKIELGGKLFEAYGRLKRIQSEITEKVGDKFELYILYGEGQDAILRFLPKEDVVINPASESLVLDSEMFKD